MYLDSNCHVFLQHHIGEVHGRHVIPRLAQRLYPSEGSLHSLCRVVIQRRWHNGQLTRTQDCPVAKVLVLHFKLDTASCTVDNSNHLCPVPLLTVERREAAFPHGPGLSRRLVKGNLGQQRQYFSGIGGRLDEEVSRRVDLHNNTLEFLTNDREGGPRE